MHRGYYEMTIIAITNVLLLCSRGQFYEHSTQQKYENEGTSEIRDKGALEGGVWWPQTSTIFLVTSHFSNEISLTSQILYWTLTYFVFFLCVSLAYLQHLESGMLCSLLYFHSNKLHPYLIIYLRIHMLSYFFTYFLT